MQSRTVILRYYRLCCLTDAVCAALHECADSHYHTVYRKSIGAEVFHHLKIEEHRHNAHRNVNYKGRKTARGYLRRGAERSSRQGEMQGVLFAHKMKEHYQHGYRGAECGRNARALNSHVEGEYKKVVAENIENTADDDRCGGKSRVGVVAQERREDAGKDVHRYGEERRAQIASAEREEKVVGSEQAEQRVLEEKEKQPQYRRISPRR